MGKLRPLIAINIVLAALFVVTIVYATVRFAPELTRLVSDPHRFREYLLSFGPWSAVVFMLFQVIQVVIAVIPGEPVQIAGGYIFGTFWGTVYSTLGITVGYIIVFTCVKLFGFPLVKKFISEKELEKFSTLINSPKLETTIFFLFLIPGIPKDILVYIAGLTPIKPVLFFIIIICARTPSMIGSSFIGAKIESSQYLIAIIVSVVASILFVFGYIYKKRIIDFVHLRFSKEKTNHE
ncbi:MAG: TVP38/TMEM64 family protein [Bacteroidota bacterium]|jgi:uncharacterized membrane protein YdjX (TVP38/TMEM64 family)